MVTTTTPGGQRVSICTCTRTGHHLATFTRRPGSSLYTLTAEPLQVAASAQVSASVPVAAPCSCRLLSHQTLLWHHRLGHPSLPRHSGMHSRLLVSGLPRSLPPLPPSPAPPCLPCVEGQQRAAPHSSSFPLTSALLQTLHMDVWGPARFSGQGRNHYFLLSVSSSASGSVRTFQSCVCTLTEMVSSPLTSCVTFVVGSFTLPASPQQNGIAKRRIGLVMEVACSSMIHAAAPHFLWPFAVHYAAHQLNLWPRVSLSETSPTLCWTGKVGDASVFRVWGSRAFVRDNSADKLSSRAIPCLNLWPRVSLSETSPTLCWTGKVGDASVFRVWGSRAFVRDNSADKLSSRAIPCVFLGFPPDAPGWQFYHPTSRRVLPSQDVTIDESVPFYCLFPYRTALLPPPPLPLFLAPAPPTVDPLPPQGPAPSGVSQVDPLPLAVPVAVAVDSRAARGAASGGAVSKGAASRGAEPASAEPASAEPRGAEPEGAEPGGAESEGAESGGAEPRGTASAGGTAGALPRLSHWQEPLSQQQLREWFAQHTRVRSGAAGARGSAVGGTGAGGAGATRLGGAGVTAGAGGIGGAGDAGPRGARTGGTGAAGAGGVGGAGAEDPGTGGTGAGGAGAGDPRAGGAGASSPGGAGAASPGGARTRGTRAAGAGGVGATGARGAGAGGAGAGGTGAGDPGAGGARAGGVGAGSPEAPVRAVRTGRRVPRPRPPLVPGTHIMALRPSSIPLRFPLPSPPASSLPGVPDPESDLARAASPTIPRLLATIVTHPLFESTAASDIVAELVDFAATCRLDYATSLVVDSESDCPLSVGGTYIDAVPSSRANIVDSMWIFRVKRPPSSPLVFKARYVARGFSQRQGVDFFHTFSPTPKMTTLRVLLHVAAQCDYELHSLDFSTAFLQGSLHEKIWLRLPPGFTGSFPAGTQWSLQRPIYGLRQVSREWNATLRTTLAALGFAPWTVDPSLFLRTDTSLPPFYILVFVDDLVFATADTEALALVKSELQKRHTCTHLEHWEAPKRVLRYLCSTSRIGLVLGGWGPVVLTGHANSSWVDDLATQRSSQGYTFSLGFDSVSWWSTRSSSVLSSSCEAEIYTGAMTAQELRWLTYLLTDLGERPHSSPVLYVDNKAMIALCQEHRLEHRTKHIALCYFLKSGTTGRLKFCVLSST
ncbi:unnamed protein product [Closterium sp. NIES-54]